MPGTTAGRAWPDAETSAGAKSKGSATGDETAARDANEHAVSSAEGEGGTGASAAMDMLEASGAEKAGGSASSPPTQDIHVDMRDNGQHTDVTTGAGLFDYSSYTGGAPLIAMGDGSGANNVDESGGASGTSEDATSTSHGVFDRVMDAVSGTHELIGKGTEGDEKKTGRPAHPSWQYFVRGEKRNRFHHHAYCRFCAENGVDPVAVRGVSGNMIGHLQKCIYCPAEVVTQLKLLCAQKDAASFNKKHQVHSRSVDILLHETSPVPTKKARRSESSEGGGATFSLRAAASRIQASGGGAGTQDSSGVEDFMPLQLPLLASEMNDQAASSANSSRMSAKPLAFSLSPSAAPAKSSAPGTKTRPQDSTKKHGKTKQGPASSGNQLQQLPGRSASPVAVNKLLASATLSLGLPWDWAWMEQAARAFGDAHSKLELPSPELLSSIGTPCHEKQLSKMKDEPVGVTLAVNCWVAKYPRSNFVLLSLVNALGEASAWELLDMGAQEPSPDAAADKIKSNLVSLRGKGIHVISIVADTTFAYTAARLAVSSSDWTSLAIPVLPCFSHLLQVLLGVVLTVSDRSTETMGDVIELVQTFTSHRVLKVLRRECGDPDALLQLPTQDNWYSFIEAVDSVRQYEEMIKIIASKVLHAASDSRESSVHARGRMESVSQRKDSAGNTVDELAECGLSSAVIRTIQSLEFWENVVALSELMSPIKETHKMMSSSFAAAFSLSDVFYQLGRMQQQYGVIVSDWEDNTGGGRSIEQVLFLQRTVNNMWKLYDQPLMVLSYMFNYNLHHPVLARHQPSLQWLSVAKYAKQYFRGWFCAASSTRNPARMLGLSDEAVAQFMEDIMAFKERKYPFDAESTCDFENPKLFYMLVSDSHPLMHMFGSRLFSFETSTPALTDVLQGKCFIPSTPSTVRPGEALLPLLQVKLFAQTAMRPSNDLLGFVQNGRPKGAYSAMANSDGQLQSDAEQGPDQPQSGAGLDSAYLHSFNSAEKTKLGEADDRSSTLAKVWNRKQWKTLAKEWKAHWEMETDTSDLLQSSRLLDTAVLRVTPDLTLDQIFKEKLPSRLPHDREDAVVDV